MIWQKCGIVVEQVSSSTRLCLRSLNSGRNSPTARRASPNVNQQISEVSTGQHSDERLRRRLEALDNIFAIANAPRIAYILSQAAANKGEL
jgi:hypothetical protein